MMKQVCLKATFVMFIPLSLCIVDSVPLNFNGTLPPCATVQTCGESDHNVAQLESRRVEQESNYESGLFLLRGPISYNGTVVSVSASGYSTVVNRTGNQQFELRLGFYDAESRRRVETVILPAECITFNESTDDSTICRVESKEKFSVTTNQYIGILFDAQCSPEDRTNRCSCRPTTTVRNTEQYLYMNTSNNNFRTLPETDGSEPLGLQFSFTFQAKGNCSGTPETSPNNMLLIAVTVSLSALTVLLLLAVASVFLHKHYRSWSRKHACKLLHRGVNNVVASHSQETSFPECNDRVNADEEQSDFSHQPLAPPPEEHLTLMHDTSSSDIKREIPPSSAKLLKISLKQLEVDLRKRNMIIPNGKLQVSRVVGQGESGLVYRGYIKSGGNNELVAIKTGNALLAVSEKERLLKEVSLMQSFNHPNVMPLIGLSFDGGTPLLVMPFMAKGNVLEYVREHYGSLYLANHEDEDQVKAARKECLGMCYQISKGMSYLANFNFVHRDLAARNCMIDGDGLIKVSDFGLTEDMYSSNYYRHDSSETETQEKVPIKWMAPESIETGRFDERTDVWSFGVTCWEVFTCGGVPYAGVPVTTLLGELRSGHRLDRPSNLAGSDDIWGVVRSCWLASPQERPKFARLVDTLTDLLDSDPFYIKILR